jgi:hypothetical protein
LSELGWVRRKMRGVLMMDEERREKGAVVGEQLSYVLDGTSSKSPRSDEARLRDCQFESELGIAG